MTEIILTILIIISDPFSTTAINFDDSNLRPLENLDVHKSKIYNYGKTSYSAIELDSEVLDLNEMKIFNTVNQISTLHSDGTKGDSFAIKFYRISESLENFATEKIFIYEIKRVPSDINKKSISFYFYDVIPDGDKLFLTTSIPKVAMPRTIEQVQENIVVTTGEIVFKDLPLSMKYIDALTQHLIASCNSK